ncbi:MAG: AmmeMemoRadiSam system protein B [Terriglobales bacterium]|jgi:AmmeMemoRadiSam system protein B/AmmeMemoRadiSam system protein A
MWVSALSPIVSGVMLLTMLMVSANDVGQVRPAAVAGTFYPADRSELEKTVDGLLAGAQVAPVQGHVWAIISPHAGYPYSGAVAAHAYALVKGQKFRRVVVIAPSHYESFDFASIYDGDAYATPLGQVAVDKSFAAKLAGASPLLQLSSRGHTPSGDRREHALEVQLPFLQRALGDFQLVPIVMGEQSYEVSRALGVALAKTITGPDTLIVASSDLSHFHKYEEASALDRKPLRAVQAWDYFSLSRNLAAGVWEACGGGPIVAAMIAAERLGATEAALLKYANTGDVTGDHSRVVGYAAAALIQSAAHRSAKIADYSLNKRDQAELLKIVRQSVETAVRQHTLLEPVAPPKSDFLLDERGAFVTLTKRGEVRGCIGYVSAVKPLYMTVRDVAAFAAMRDPRFPPVAPVELGALEYEISVLSPLRRVTDAKQIQIGRHGLLVKKGNREGVLLPQVPVEQGWNRQTFLEQVCLKAGLPPNAWKDEETDLFMFTALVFGEQRNPSDSGEPWQRKEAGPPGSGLGPPPR